MEVKGVAKEAPTVHCPRDKVEVPVEAMVKGMTDILQELFQRGYTENLVLCDIKAEIQKRSVRR